MKSPLLFNPRQADTETLERTFVAREPVLSQLLADIHSDQGPDSRRQWQVIGPRGSGKSHLLELLNRRLGDAGWTVVRLPEEHYRVRDLATLLEVIAGELGVRPEFERGISVDTIIDRCADAIRQVDRDSGGRLVVIIENLGLLFGQKVRKRTDQQRLRSLLMHDPLFTMVGSATRHLGVLHDEKQPFYAFFQTVVLDDLDRKQVVELVRTRAQFDGAAELLARFDQVRPRIEALYLLSGGDPRLVMLLYLVLREGVSQDVHQDLITLLDEVTPYYQARLADLSPQMQDVLVDMALHNDPIVPSELGRRLRMPTNQVTAVLKKLQDERVVEPGARRDKRSRYWQVSERLFRIWLQMREGGGVSDKLSFLLDFFRIWYAGFEEEARSDAIAYGQRFWEAMVAGQERRAADLGLSAQYVAEAAAVSYEVVLDEAAERADLDLAELAATTLDLPVGDARAACERELRRRVDGAGGDAGARALALVALGEFEEVLNGAAVPPPEQADWDLGAGALAAALLLPGAVDVRFGEATASIEVVRLAMTVTTSMLLRDHSPRLRPAVRNQLRHGALESANEPQLVGANVLMTAGLGCLVGCDQAIRQGTVRPADLRLDRHAALLVFGAQACLGLFGGAGVQLLRRVVYQLEESWLWPALAPSCAFVAGDPVEPLLGGLAAEDREFAEAILGIVRNGQSWAADRGLRPPHSPAD